MSFVDLHLSEVAQMVDRLLRRRCVAAH
ncbi:hypothetical protein ACNKHW_18260 [Shigella flexneri]